MKEQCLEALNFFGYCDLIPTKVSYINPNSGLCEEILLFDDISECSFSEDIDSTNAIDKVSMLLYIKDRFAISDKAWQELSAVSKHMTPLSSIKSLMSTLNSNWNIYPTPGDTNGVQMSFVQSLNSKISKLVNDDMFKTETDDGNACLNLKIKISGDGTQIGKRLNVVNVTYTILNEKLCMSERGNYPLAIVKCKEDYNSMKLALSDLVKELSEYKHIRVDKNVYNIEYFLGGDWKFLAMACGLGAAATANFACIWCKAPKEPLDHVVIDTLHLFLRIADTVIENFIQELRVLDTINKKSLFKSGVFCREKHTHMTKYESFLQDIGIRFRWKINKDTNRLEYRDLTGPEKLLLFQKIQIADLIGASSKAIEIQNLWDNFSVLIVKLKLDYNDNVDLDLFASDIKSWIR